MDKTKRAKAPRKSKKVAPVFRPGGILAHWRTVCMLDASPLAIAASQREALYAEIATSVRNGEYGVA